MQKFLNHHGYSDITPYEVVRVVSEKCVEIRRMTATLDPSWKPEIVPGGFAGHCTNQHKQKWNFESDLEAPVIKCRKVKPSRANRGQEWKSVMGYHTPADAPRSFYDYNF